MNSQPSLGGGFGSKTLYPGGAFMYEGFRQEALTPQTQNPKPSTLNFELKPQILIDPVWDPLYYGFLLIESRPFLGSRHRIHKGF